MRFPSTIGLSIALLAMAACGDTAPTGITSDDLAGQAIEPTIRHPQTITLPFVSAYKTTFVFGAQQGEILVQGKGTGRPLGRGTLFIDEFLNPTTMPNELTGVRVVFTGRSGDEVWATFAGVTRPPFPPPPAVPGPVVTFRGKFTITGGTGRYVNATGGGHFHGSADLPSGTGKVRWIGHVTRHPA